MVVKCCVTPPTEEKAEVEVAVRAILLPRRGAEQPGCSDRFEAAEHARERRVQLSACWMLAAHDTIVARQPRL